MHLRWLRRSVVRTSVSDRRTFPGLRSICSGCVTTYVGITSAIGQPTRPTQRFILPGLQMSSELELDVCHSGGAIWRTFPR